MKKYLVIADYVISKNDRDRHFITCNQLMLLYAVHEEECICVESAIKGWSHPPKEYYLERNPNLIVLRPNRDGDYSIPESKCTS